MADPSEFDAASLQEVANAVQDSNEAAEAGARPKRKREPMESPDATRRSNPKRVPTNDSSLLNDGSTDAFMDGQQESDVAVESLQDFDALQQQHDHSNGTSDHANASSTAAAALGIYPTMTVPQSTDVTFAQQVEADRNQDSFMGEDSQGGDDSYISGNTQSGTGRGSGSKPAVGSDEWHKVRKDNHKEVERRRRETINEGINELAKIVPGCEKNKGSILQRAVQFITQLRENETQNLEKWTLEKLLTEQAIAELSTSNDKLKAECERAWREVETWKKTCQSAGLQPKKEDLSGNNDS